MPLVPKQALVSQGARDYWLEMAPKLQGPDSSVFNDQDSESSANSDSDIKGSEPAPAIEPDFDETGSEFHNSPGQGYLSESSTKSHAKDNKPAPAIDNGDDEIQKNRKDTDLSLTICPSRKLSRSHQ